MSKVLLFSALVLVVAVGANLAPTRAYFASLVAVAANTFATGTWSVAPAAPNLGEVETALVASDEASGSGQLYDLMSSSFQGLFSASDFAAMWGGGDGIASIEYLTPLSQTLGSEWYEQHAKITFASGTIATYNLIFRLEDGKWKLYATEDI